jgi:glutathione synthase/RimK-type ligase-like ATP-grasp enzyme
VPTVVLLTCAELPLFDLDTAPLTVALRSLGAAVDVRAWSDPVLLDSEADLFVLRSPWDYFDRREEFLAAIDRFAVPVLNPPTVVRWNSHKAYLADLAAAGVPVVPTVVLTRGDAPVVPDMDQARIIVKPAVSGSAVGIGRFDRGSADAAAHLGALLAGQDVLVQPFVESVREGERSLFYFGGRLSHAVHKVPAEDDFRVQVQYGGRNTVHQATTAEIDAAETALAAVPNSESLLYARVDLIDSAAGPLVMELELIEPELFLPLNPGAADRYAATILARI